MRLSAPKIFRKFNLAILLCPVGSSLILALTYRLSPGFSWAALCFAVSLNAALVYACLLFVRSKLERNSRIAMAVMNELRSGRLQARFPVRTDDEIGRLMTFFNEMADRVEDLVAKNKQMERAKSKWLQDLAHDLRTPLASLDMSVMSLIEGADSLASDKKLQLLSSSAHEITYIKDLVEDLLFLGLIETQDYFKSGEIVDLGDFLDRETLLFEEKAERLGKSFVAGDEFPGVMLAINPKLLRRLLRNCLDNAFYYAKSEIQLSVRDAGATIELEITNDVLKPLSEETLRAFGKRRNNRESYNLERGGAPSLGLGSLVISEIVRSLGGTVNLKNTERDSRGFVLLKISIPKIEAKLAA